jgi:hypothetical protein
MGFSRPQATSNANSKVLRIGRIVEQRERPSIDQMEVIGRIVDEYRAEVPGWAREQDPRPEHDTAVRSGARTFQPGPCHCDGPTHPWSPPWCPVSGPVTR